MDYLTDLIEKSKKKAPAAAEKPPPPGIPMQKPEEVLGELQKPQPVPVQAPLLQAKPQPVQASGPSSVLDDLRRVTARRESLSPVQEKRARADTLGPSFKSPEIGELRAAGEPAKKGASLAPDVLGLTPVELREKKEAMLEKQESEKFEKSKKKLLAKYGGVEIYKLEGEPLFFYKAQVTRPTMAERRVINTIREAATRLIAVEPYEIKDPEQRKNVYTNKVLDIIDAAGAEIQIPSSRRRYYAEEVVKEMIGFGALDILLADDSIEDIMVIGANKPVYVFHRTYEMMKTNLMFYDDASILDVIDKIGRMIGRRIDRAEPLLDARLPDGSRVNATIEPVSLGGPTLSIRKFRLNPFSLTDMLALGTINLDLAAFLWLAADGMNVKPANILVSGGTGSGKTTMLNVMCSMIPDSERVISIEDTAELQLPIEHWVRFEKRLPSIEGTGEINMDALVKNSLRMRPDRIIVGEVRGEEAGTLFTAMNTGHDGSMGTLHANSAVETKVRITSPPMSVPEAMLSALDLVIVLERIHLREKGTIRRVIEVAEVTGALEGNTHMSVIFKWSPASDSIERTQFSSLYVEKLSEFTGMSKEELEKELQVRKEFLEGVVKENVRDQDEVSRRMKDFLIYRTGGPRLEDSIERKLGIQK